MPAEPAKPLTTKQAAHLRALAHHLDPVVQLGKEGLSDAVITAVRTALETHELIKVKLPQVEKAERKQLVSGIASATGAHIAGEIGRVAVLYKRHPNKPKIALPKSSVRA
jgi:RNA-binding protein